MITTLSTLLLLGVTQGVKLKSRAQSMLDLSSTQQYSCSYNIERFKYETSLDFEAILNSNVVYNDESFPQEEMLCWTSTEFTCGSSSKASYI